MDDVDELLSNAHEFAFTEDNPVLPNDVSRLADTINCYKIESYDKYPGFVRLRALGKLNYDWKNKKFLFSGRPSIFPDKDLYLRHDFVESHKNLIKATRPLSFKVNVKGPALSYRVAPDETVADTVHSVRCSQWPLAAHDWPKRPRTCGWPTAAKISEVVQSGCHVVYVQHRSCREDKEQWRISFSIAEAILLQSWTTVQQLIYHLLRYFAKKELIQNDCPKENEVLCPYHFKTLMLWTCEEKSSREWNCVSVFSICSELMQKISNWLKMRYCNNYFIPEANLFHESFNSATLEQVERRLNEFQSRTELCLWFFDNYIKAMISEIEERLEGPMDHLMRLLVYRKQKTTESLDFLFACGYMKCDFYFRNIFKYKITSGLEKILEFACSARKLGAITYKPMLFLPIMEHDSCFIFFDKAVCSLLIVYGLDCGNMSWDSGLFLEYIKSISWKPKIVRCLYHRFPEPFLAEKSLVQLLHAQDLMSKLTGSNIHSECHLLSFLSREFLLKVLQCRDSHSSRISAVALAYLAALHFATSERHVVRYLCSRILMSQTTCMENETLDASCLFFIGDVVRIVGLCLLFKKLNDNEKYFKRHVYLDLRIKPSVLAYYLAVMTAGIVSEQSELKHNLSTSAFPCEQFLLILTKTKFCTQTKSRVYIIAGKECVYHRTATLMAGGSSSVDILTFEEQLTEHAFENMTIFYRLFSEDYGIQCSNVDCYRALDLYKRRQYDASLHLCKQILQVPDVKSDLKEFGFANVLILPPFNCFFDGNVNCLLGFHTLCYYLSPRNEELAKIVLMHKSRFAHFFAREVYSSEYQLSSCLQYPSSIRNQYFVGRHFLARYLTLRCCIACNYPFEEAMAEFYDTENNFPFEHIIRQFLQKTLPSF